MAANDLKIEHFQIPESESTRQTGTKPKVYKDGQYSDPMFKKLSRINGEVNRLNKPELQAKLKEHGLDSRGQKEILKKRLKNYYKKRNMKRAKLKIDGKTPYDYIAVIDFEATCDENNPSYRHEIIEFPIVLVDVDKMEIVDKFHEYVQPVVNPILTPFCTKLTGISQGQVDKADTFPSVLERVEAWLEAHQLGLEKSFAVLTDGPWDMFRFMYYQCKESGIEMPKWSKKWINIRKSYCNFYQLGRGGIETMLQTLGMKFEGSPHSGLDDSVNIARIAVKMLGDGCRLSINEHIQITESPDNSGVTVRYEPWKEDVAHISDGEENCEEKTEKLQERQETNPKSAQSGEGDRNDEKSSVVDKMEKMTLLDVNQMDGLEDLLAYYKLQKT